MAFAPHRLPPLVTRRLILRRLTSVRDSAAVTAQRLAFDKDYGRETYAPALADPMRYDRERTRKHRGAVFYGFLRNAQEHAVVRLGVMLDKDRDIRVSYETHPDFRRQGFAAEAQLAMVTALAKAYPLKSFKAEIDIGHTASQKILLRSGFQIAGVRLSRLLDMEPIKGVTFIRPSLSSHRKIHPAAHP